MIDPEHGAKGRGGFSPEIVSADRLQQAAAWAARYMDHGENSEDLQIIVSYLASKIENALNGVPHKIGVGRIPELERAFQGIPDGAVTLHTAAQRLGVTTKILYKRVYRAGIQPVYQAFHLGFYDYEKLKNIISAHPPRYRKQKQDNDHTEN